MSDSNRGKRSEAWLGLALAVAAIVGGTIYWDASKDETISQIEAENRAADYAEAAWKDVTPACLASELSTADCAKEAQERYRPEQRNEYDLAAQRTMAAWTRAMGLAALVGMAVGIFGLGLIWRTWDATREAAVSSSKTLRSFIAKERAILIPNGAFKALDVEEMAEGFVVKFSNSGNAPATIEQADWSYVTGRNWPEELGATRQSKRVIIPNGNGRSPHLFWPSEPSRSSYLMGRVIYTTLDSERFETYFAYRVAYRDDDGYQPGGWDAEEAFISNMPEST